MSVNIKIIDPKGNFRPIRISLSQTVLSKKKELNIPDAFWKFEGEILKDERTFDSYGIEENDVIGTNTLNQGGLNIKLLNIL